MGKVLVAYYSFEGHTEEAAKKIAEELRAAGDDPQLLKINVRKEPPKSGLKFLVGGFNALTQGDPGILNEDVHINDYDRIFLGTPVWAGNAPGAIKAFIRKTKPEGKRFYLFAMSGGGDEKKTFPTITGYLQGNEVVKTISLRQGGSFAGLQEFCRDRKINEELRQKIKAYIDEVYDEDIEELPQFFLDSSIEAAPLAAAAPFEKRESRESIEAAPYAGQDLSYDSLMREHVIEEEEEEEEPKFARSSIALGSADLAFELDESFSEYLFRKIDERGLKDSDCYKKANVSKQVFSNIKSNPDYLPSKTTILAFAIALQMDLEETRDLLERAGYALSHSSKLDVIVEYFIKNGIYDLFEINNTLFSFDQKLLGSR